MVLSSRTIVVTLDFDAAVALRLLHLVAWRIENSIEAGRWELRLDFGQAPLGVDRLK